MLKIFNFKTYSLTTKTLFAFFVIIIILIAIRALLIQPKIKEKNLKNEINFITGKLNLIEDVYREHENINIEELKKILIKNSTYKNLNINIAKSKEKIKDINYIEWIVTLNKNTSNPIYLRYTINKKEIYNSKDLGIFFLLPETLIAIIISLIIFMLILKRMLTNIDLLTKKLKKSLDEKEILLKEIHHRVKNNLSMTIGLIELQENEIKDKNSQKALIDIKERIYTMELLHKKLYESKNMNSISFKVYIEDLIKLITNAYDKKNIMKISLDIIDVYLDIETTMSYGIIINELVTNSFKYAYNNNENPKIEIKIENKNNARILILKDNGEGLKNNFNTISKQTLGLKLISNIVKFKLSGKFTYNYKNGSIFKIITKI